VPLSPVLLVPQAEQMVRKLDRQGSVLGDLGLALFAMAKLEEGAGGALAVATGTLRHSTSMVSDTKRMGTGLVRLTRQNKRVVSYTALHLSQLHEYMGAMPVSSWACMVGLCAVCASSMRLPGADTRACCASQPACAADSW
jgi:hypothetical protein